MRDAQALVLAVNPGQGLSQVSQAEGLESAVGEGAAPRVKHHDGLCTGFDLRIEVGRHRVCVDAQQVVHEVGAPIHQGLDLMVVVTAPALDHVTRQGPGAARKPNQGHARGAV